MDDELPTPEAFIEAYARGEDQAERVRQLASMASRGLSADLRTLWTAAQTKRYGIFDRRRGSLRALARDVEQALAGAQNGAALGLLAQLLGQGGPRSGDELGALANRIGGNADVTALEALALHAARLPVPLFVNAVQAAVLHDAPLSAVPTLATAWREHAAGHPQFRLPLERLAAESNLVLPSRAASRSSEAERGRDGGNVAPLSVAAMSRRDGPLPALRSWTERSNGRTEWVELELSEPIESVSGPQLLALGLESLADGVEDEFTLRDEPLAEVVSTLFSASLGGAYAMMPGLGDARLHTWSSVALLCGLHETETPQRVEAEAHGHRWWSFDPVGAWFNRVAWDLGLVCLRAGGTRIVFVAATDTD